jgi:2,3-bisphosphoglycerate-dependent phosphoglycerate mutase
MTRIYFVRHAEPDKTVTDDRKRPLTAQGLEDTQFVYETLKDKGIDIAISSPYKRSFDTIKRLADALEISIQTDERFREREAGAKGQGLRKHPERWKKTEWKNDWGESIQDVKKRNIEALMDVLDKYDGHNIVLGTHGTAFSTILDHLSPIYGYDDFIRMMDWMPNIVEIIFEGKEVVEINEVGHIDKNSK